MYVTSDKSDGVYHRKHYDISEIDTKANFLYRMEKQLEEDQNGPKKRKAKCIPSSESVMEMMFGKHTLTATAVEMVKTSELMRYLIDIKWEKYRGLFRFWWFFYLSVLTVVTFYMIYRIDFLFTEDNKKNFSQFALTGDIEHDFVLVTFFMLFPLDGIGVILVLMLLFAHFVGRNNSLMYTSHNIDYVVFFSGFVFGILVDCIIILSDNLEIGYNGEALIIAVVFGWLFATIFLRPLRHLGRTVDLVRSVVISDIVSFTSLFTILLVGFAAGFHSLFKYKSDDTMNTSELVDDHGSFQKTLFILFNVMLGLTEMHGDDNSIYDTSVPWLAIVMYVVFMIAAYALLVNALIAIMTHSCGSIFEDAYDYQRVHKLSVMIFMDELFGLNHIFRCCLQISDWKENNKYFVEVKIKEEDRQETQIRARNYFKLYWQHGSRPDSEEELARRKEELNAMKTDIIKSMEDTVAKCIDEQWKSSGQDVSVMRATTSNLNVQNLDFNVEKQQSTTESNQQYVSNSFLLEQFQNSASTELKNNVLLQEINNSMSVQLTELRTTIEVQQKKLNIVDELRMKIENQQIKLNAIDDIKTTIADQQTILKAICENIKRLETQNLVTETMILHTVETVCSKCGTKISAEKINENITLDEIEPTIKQYKSTVPIKQ